MKSSGWIALAIAAVVAWWLISSASAAAQGDSPITTDESGGDGSDPNDGGTDVSSNPVSAIAEAIANGIQRAEGFYAGSVSQRDNNPGNIMGSGDAGTDSAGHSIFTTLAAGTAALVGDITHKLTNATDGETLQDLLARYVYGTATAAQLASTEFQNYVGIVSSYLAAATGMDVDGSTQISDLTGN